MKNKKHRIPKIPPLVTSPADLRLLQTVGKSIFVMLAGKKMANWEPSLRATTFLQKGNLRKYTDKSVMLKIRAMTVLCNQGLMRDLLFDIYYQPSHLDIKTRKLAGRYYKRLCKNAKLPPMVR